MWWRGCSSRTGGRAELSAWLLSIELLLAEALQFFTHSLAAAAAQFRCIWVSAVVFIRSAWMSPKPRCCLIKLMDVGELKLNCRSLNNRWTARVSLLLICITVSLIRFPMCSSFFSLFPSCSSGQMLTGCEACWSELENKLTPSAVEMLVCEFAWLKIKERFSCVQCN